MTKKVLRTTMKRPATFSELVKRSAAQQKRKATLQKKKAAKSK